MSHQVQTIMKIATWNLRHGGGSRIRAICNVVRDLSTFDVLIFTEFRENKNASTLKKQCELLGFVHLFSSVNEPKKNGVLVASKAKMSASTAPELLEHQHRVVIAEIGRIHLYGCYFPQREAKEALFHFLQKQATTNLPIVVTGDINTGLHFKDEQRASFYCAEHFEALLKSGLSDAYRHLHPDKAEFSWYSNVGNGFRIDHFLVSDSMVDQVLGCEYLHEPREQKSSDHSVMALHLSL